MGRVLLDLLCSSLFPFYCSQSCFFPLSSFPLGFSQLAGLFNNKALMTIQHLPSSTQKAIDVEAKEKKYLPEESKVSER